MFTLTDGINTQIYFIYVFCEFHHLRIPQLNSKASNRWTNRIERRESRKRQIDTSSTSKWIIINSWLQKKSFKDFFCHFILASHNTTVELRFTTFNVSFNPSVVNVEKWFMGRNNEWILYKFEIRWPSLSTSITKKVINDRKRTFLQEKTTWIAVCISLN